MFEYGRLGDFRVDVQSLSFRPFDVASPDEDEEGEQVGRTSRAEVGPRGWGTKSAAVWTAKHSPLCEDIIAELEAFEPVDGYPWRPDIFRESRDGRLVLIEVKPDCDSHNIITEIGQLIAYSHVVTAQGIELLDLDDLRAQLLQILERAPRPS
ncbi:MAG: hypothetical protein JO312_25910 [Hyphomicrobiales bacterium]|nr:hypothetical protein [Hyphomicrobiales bacterium]